MNKILFILITLAILSCGEDDKQLSPDGNILGGPGKNSSYEAIERFPSQLFSESIIKENDGAASAPLITNATDIYFSTQNGKVIKTYKNQSDWEFELDTGQIINTAMCFDTNNNIYGISNTGVLYSVSDSGKKNWTYNYKDVGDLEIFNSLLYFDGKIISSSSKGRVKVLNTDGEIKYELQKDNFAVIDPMSASGNNILITYSQNNFGKTDTLVSYNNDFSKNWSFYEESFRFTKGAVTNGEYIAIAGSKQGGDNPLSKLFVLNMKGELQWSKEISNLPRYISIANNGEVYLVSFSSGMGQMLSGVFSYNADGELNWKIYYKYSIPMPVFINQEQITFIASNRATYGMFFLNRSDGKLHKTVNIGNAAPLHFIPNVDYDGSIVFGGQRNLRIIRIDQTPMDKLLPY